jgi:hypothetical protein
MANAHVTLQRLSDSMRVYDEIIITSTWLERIVSGMYMWVVCKCSGVVSKCPGDLSTRSNVCDLVHFVRANRHLAFGETGGVGLMNFYKGKDCLSSRI